MKIDKRALKNKFIELFMFIPLQKQLLASNDPAESRRVENILLKAYIPYRIFTRKARGSIGMAYDTRSYSSHNLAMYKGSSLPTVVYEFFVRRKDFDCAKKLITHKID